MPFIKKIYETDKKIGENIRIMREIRGINIKTLADKMGITYGQLRKYEKGINRISASAILNCTKIMNCPIDYFFDNIHNKENKKCQ